MTTVLEVQPIAKSNHVESNNCFDDVVILMICCVVDATIYEQLRAPSIILSGTCNCDARAYAVLDDGKVLRKVSTSEFLCESEA
jgi:hypothetical protein